ncbi:MAG: ribosome biogenesis GTP-binding protein YihA/YsxC [Bauldia sp.]
MSASPKPPAGTPNDAPHGATEDAAARHAAFLEKGRRFFARPWEFVRGVPSLDRLPPVAGLEVAFAGRSNVGKSSLINALVGRHGLARTSNTPGRTQELNYFAADGDFFLVDMPGYGYAAAAKAKAARWTELVFAYLRARPNLRRVYLLIDARHGVMAKDGTVLDLLDKAAVSYQAVLTKADKLKAGELVETTAAVAAALKKRPAAHPVIIATSSETGAGIAELRAEIAAIAAPGDPDIPVFTEAH